MTVPTNTTVNSVSNSQNKQHYMKLIKFYYKSLSNFSFFNTMFNHVRVSNFVVF